MPCQKLPACRLSRISCLSCASIRAKGGPLFVQTDCVYREAGQTFVLRLPGVSFHASGQPTAVGKHVPEKVEVSLGEEYFTVNKWNFRSLRESGGLVEGDFLAVGPTKAHEEGLAIGRPQWLLRPGDLVPVRFHLDFTPRGFYVPVDAIVKRAGNHSVFAVRDGVARKVAVAVSDTFGELRRIEGEGIGRGTQIVVRGAHYVSDGQPISIVGEEDDAT